MSLPTHCCSIHFFISLPRDPRRVFERLRSSAITSPFGARPFVVLVERAPSSLLRRTAEPFLPVCRPPHPVLVIPSPISYAPSVLLIDTLENELAFLITNFFRFSAIFKLSSLCPVLTPRRASRAQSERNSSILSQPSFPLPPVTPNRRES